MTIGNAARANGARDAFVVERPEVLERAAAARDDQHVALARARPPMRSASMIRGTAAAPCTGVG